jgi:hypothetical protein
MSQTTNSRKDFSRAAAESVIKQAIDKWPSTFVARAQIHNFTGGLLAPGTAANNDCLGTGIPGAFRVGRQICYPATEVVTWLLQRLEA